MLVRKEVHTLILYTGSCHFTILANLTECENYQTCDVHNNANELTLKNKVQSA